MEDSGLENSESISVTPNEQVFIIQPSNHLKG